VVNNYLKNFKTLVRQHPDYSSILNAKSSTSILPVKKNHLPATRSNDLTLQASFQSAIRSAILLALKVFIKRT